MAQNAKTVSHGTAGGSTINADMARIDHGQTKRVTLSASYDTARHPGTPTRPQFTGAEASKLDYPRTIPSGTVLTLSVEEAAALVAAGRATYA